jgi:predicted dehydrogenase
MKLALLGYGFMGGAHLAAMQRIDGVEVKAVAARTRPSNDGPSRGNMQLASGPLPDTVAWTPVWQSIIADPEIDAVDICLPTDMHREVVLAALAAGKHVLCEKPMALTSADCTKIMAAAEASGRIFMVGQVLRFMYPYIYASSFLDEVGRHSVRRCVLSRSTGYPQWGGWLTQTERSGGAILDLLSHDIDQALYLFGSPQVFQGVSFGQVDTMRATLSYDSGLEVVVEGGWLMPEASFDARFAIESSEARLEFKDNSLVRSNPQGTSALIDIPEHDPYFDEIAYFIDCCRNGTQPARCLPAESALAVELSLQLKASRDSGGREMKWQK